MAFCSEELACFAACLVLGAMVVQGWFECSVLLCSVMWCLIKLGHVSHCTIKAPMLNYQLLGPTYTKSINGAEYDVWPSQPITTSRKEGTSVGRSSVERKQHEALTSHFALGA